MLKFVTDEGRECVEEGAEGEEAVWCRERVSQSIEMTVTEARETKKGE